MNSYRLPFTAGAVVAALALAACGSSEMATPDVDDSILSEQRTGFVTVDGETTNFTGAEFADDFELDEPTPALLGYVGADGEAGLVVVPFDLEEETPTGELLYFTTAGASEQASDVEFAEVDDEALAATGTFESGAEFEVELALGAGTSTFELEGNRAIVRGDLGSTAFDQVAHLTENHPEVDTLVLQMVPGSVNDEINVQTGRLVREAGYTTIIPSDGLAASGGVDLFAAGIERIAEPGAQVGIHSWCCTEENVSPADLSQDDPRHDDQLAYFSIMLGEQLGPEFYFQTLNAAPADNIHYMTDEELAVSTIATNR